MEEPKRRSRAYPFIALQAAVELLEQIRGALGEGAYGREQISVALGYCGRSSGAARRIAALSHFGLLERQGKLYRPSARGLLLLSEAGEEVFQEAMEACFLEPPVFREVVEKYLPRGRLPRLLAFVLAQDHGIGEKVAHDVAGTLVASGASAAVMTTEGVFLEDFLVRRLGAGKAVGRQVLPLQEEVTLGAAPSEDRPQVLDLMLTDQKRARLEIPSRLNDADIAILEHQVAVLRVQVEGNRVVAPIPIRRRAGQ